MNPCTEFQIWMALAIAPMAIRSWLEAVSASDVKLSHYQPPTT